MVDIDMEDHIAREIERIKQRCRDEQRREVSQMLGKIGMEVVIGHKAGHSTSLAHMYNKSGMAYQ